jgi:hypothetical protein
MMGQQGSKQDQLFYAFNLEEHVPRSHLLRSIDRFFDLGELRARLTASTATLVAHRSIRS